MSTWIAKDAVVFGDIRFGDNCSVYYHTVIRTEDGTFSFGECTTIEDNCVIHGGGAHPVITGNNVTVGHSCILHGCTIGSNTLIGMGSIIMSGAEIGNNCIIGAGSLVTENTVIPDNTVAYGRPARIIRPVTQEDIRNIQDGVRYYQQIRHLHENQ